MHELSIALRLVELVEEQLHGEPPDTTISAVDIHIGALSSVVPEALQFAWGPATDGTRLAGAALRIKPQLIDAYVQRARAYEKQLKRDLALADLKRALSLADKPEDKATIQAELDRLTKQ